MKMKNFMAIALAATMLALVGCGNTNDSSSTVADVPDSTEATTEAAATTTTAVETTTVEATTAETTEPDEPAGDSMAFADMADAIDKAMSAHANDPADTADNMLELCRATIEDLKTNGLPLGEYTGEVGELDENGESHGENSIGKVNTISAIVCKMPASTLSVSDIEGVTLESVSSYSGIITDSTGTTDSYSVTLRFNTGETDTAMKKANQNIFSYFIENGYTDTGRDDLTNIEIAHKYGGLEEGCRVQVKNDKFEIMITPDSTNGACEISFNKL